VKRPLVQILVLVANSRARNSAAEVEKGSTTTVFGRGLVDPKALGSSNECVHRSLPKGNPANIPGPGLASGNTNSPEDAWEGGEESYLFLLTSPLGSKSDCLEQRQGRRKSTAQQCSQCPLKLLKIRGNAGPVRTHNRIRSPRLAASSRWNNAGKGSRQIGSVTSGKGLALGAGWSRARRSAGRFRVAG